MIKGGSGNPKGYWCTFQQSRSFQLIKRSSTSLLISQGSALVTKGAKKSLLEEQLLMKQNVSTVLLWLKTTEMEAVDRRHGSGLRRGTQSRVGRIAIGHHREISVWVEPRLRGHGRWERHGLSREFCVLALWLPPGAKPDENVIASIWDESVLCEAIRIRARCLWGDEERHPDNPIGIFRRLVLNCISTASWPRVAAAVRNAQAYANWEQIWLVDLESRRKYLVNTRSYQRSLASKDWASYAGPPPPMVP